MRETGTRGYPYKKILVTRGSSHDQAGVNTNTKQNRNKNKNTPNEATTTKSANESKARRKEKLSTAREKKHPAPCLELRIWQGN